MFNGVKKIFNSSSGELIVNRSNHSLPDEFKVRLAKAHLAGTTLKDVSTEFSVSEAIVSSSVKAYQAGKLEA
jgi:transposase-like protein